MAVYVNIRKLWETDDDVVYCSIGADGREKGSFRLSKNIHDGGKLGEYSENIVDSDAFPIIGKLLRYVRENGSYPETLTKES